jgi:hypothetical protein
MKLGSYHSKEARIKMSLAHIGIQAGKNHPMWGTHLSKKTRRKISKSLKGRPFSEERKQKISKAHIGLFAGNKHPLWGKHPSKETRKKMSKNSAKIWLGKHLPKETKEKIKEATLGINNHNYGKQFSKKIRKKMGLARKGKNMGKNHPLWGKENKWGHHTEENKKKIGMNSKGKHPLKKTRKKMSKNNARFWLGKHRSQKTKQKISKAQTPEMREQSRQRCIKMIMKGFKPSKFEKRIIKLIKQNNLPWKYIGDGREGSFFGKLPDFINTNGQKAFAEAYDDYWHDEDYVPKRRRFFAKFGFKTRFIHYDDSDEKIIRILGK